MNFQSFLDRHCGILQILAYFNVALSVGAGSFHSVQGLIGSIAYTQIVHNMTMSESESGEEEGVEDENSLSIHVEENRDVLLHSVYFLTSLLWYYTCVELFNGILLIRLTYAHQMKSNITWARKLWTILHANTIFAVLLTFAIHFPLKHRESIEEIVKDLTPVVLFLLWKIFILIIFKCCDLSSRNSNPETAGNDFMMENRQQTENDQPA